MESIMNKLDKSYTLMYCDRSDNLDESHDTINDCIQAHNLEPLYEIMDSDWTFDAENESVDYIIKELDLTDEEREWIDADYDNHIAIEEAIRDRDDSDYLKDMMKNTWSVPVRLHAHSNYDCMNSDYSESPYSYGENYFTDMIDILNLNPRKVQEAMNPDRTAWEFPDKPERNGNEYIAYSDLDAELANSCGSCNLLTFIWLLDISELTNKDDNYTVTIPAGNSCGLFDKDTGSWSLIECKLLRDFTVTLEVQSGKTIHDNYSLYTDDNKRGYGIGDVYGVTRKFFWEEITIK